MVVTGKKRELVQEKDKLKKAKKGMVVTGKKRELVQELTEGAKRALWPIGCRTE